jgi:glycosyltransferase involved in cell wall biosynthesis
VFHAVGNVDLPLLRIPGMPFVLTVHDLIPLTSPRTVSWAFHWQFRLWLARSLRVADHVVCVSAWTREQLLLRHPELDPARVSVVHNGVDHVQPRALDAVSQAWLRSLGLPERWILFAGALDARKNLELVLEALGRLGPRAPTLVLAGQRWSGSGAIERRIGVLRAAGVDIRPLGFLAEPLLWGLMAAAPVFVFPSRDEGFGLPPLEAMALGTPVVVSTAAALPEVCGEAAVQVAPDDAGGLATALQRLLDDPAERTRRSDAGRAHARAFRWDSVGAHLVEVYRRLVRT